MKQFPQGLKKFYHFYDTPLWGRRPYKTFFAEKENRENNMAAATYKARQRKSVWPEIPESIKKPNNIGDADVLITARDAIRARIAPRCFVP